MSLLLETTFCETLPATNVGIEQFNQTSSECSQTRLDKTCNPEEDTYKNISTQIDTTIGDQEILGQLKEKFTSNSTETMIFTITPMSWNYRRIENIQIAIEKRKATCRSMYYFRR